MVPSGPAQRYDFFLSRRGSVAAVAIEVADVLKENGYKVNVEDYDFRPGASFVEAMHEGIKNSRDLLILYTADYEARSTPARSSLASWRRWRKARRSGTSSSCAARMCRCGDFCPTFPFRTSWASSMRKNASGASSLLLSANRRQRHRRHGRSSGCHRVSRASQAARTNLIGSTPSSCSDKPAAVTQASVGRAAVQGMGGVGKTSLAIEYAHRFRGLYAGVCWCPAETRTGLLSALAGLAVTMGAATTDEADVEKAAKAGLRRLAEQRATWLLVYDNVPAPDAIADLLPSAGARLLITSRFSDWSEVADEVELDVLPPQEAVGFLQSRTGRSDAVGAETLVEALGRLPLALDHAAAYCKRTQTRFGDYATKASSFISAAPRGAGYPRSVAATFDLAITEAVTQCPAAEALMAYLAQCAPDRIPMSLVEGAVEDEVQRMKALAALAEVSLLKHDPFEDATPAVTVHRLVQAVARARSEANGSAQDAVGRLIARLVAIYPNDGYNPQSWPLCAQLTPHLAAQKAAAVEGIPILPHWPVLLSRGGSYVWGRGSFKQAASFYRDALVIREKTLGPEHPDTAENLNDLGFLLQLQGDLTGARPLFERALAIREKVLGPDHPVTAESLSNLGLLLQAEDDLAGARPLFERALAIREKKLGLLSIPIRRRSLHNLARLLQDRGDLAGQGRSSNARWQSARRVLGSRASRYGDEPQQPRSSAPGPG